MATPQAAQRSIHALRQEIARIESEGGESRSPAAGWDGRDDGSPAARDGIADSSASAAVDAADSAAQRRPGTVFPLGIPPFDRAMNGGFPAAGLSEIRGEESRNWGAVCAFALMVVARLRQADPRFERPMVWIAAPEARREGGEPWLPGFAEILPSLGSTLAGGREVVPPLLLVRPRTTLEALWAAETAAASGAIGAVIAEIRGNPACLGLKESRRLHFRARRTGRPLLLLRQAGAAEATAAPIRFLIEPAPSGLRWLAADMPLAGSLGHPAVTATLEKSRSPAPLSLILEWSPDECRFTTRPRAERPDSRAAAPLSGSVLSLPFDRPDHPPASGPTLAFGRAS